jgi:O-acetyl-ADP-ribose deacetylase (regulator of RNase III)
LNWEGITYEIIQGNIADQKDIEVIVNAAHPEYRADGGVSASIHEMAGVGLYEHRKSLAPLHVGQVVITPAFNLKNKFIIHSLGPRYGVDKSPDRLLALCYENALKLADHHRFRSVAFPAISTGSMEYPLRDAAAVALTTIMDQSVKLKYIKLIRLVVNSESKMDTFQDIFLKLIWSKRELTSSK